MRQVNLHAPAAGYGLFILTCHAWYFASLGERIKFNADNKSYTCAFCGADMILQGKRTASFGVVQLIHVAEIWCRLLLQSR